MTTLLRVHFDGSVLVPEQSVDLPVGQSLEVYVAGPSQGAAGTGSPSAVVRAARTPPHISSEEAAELESAIRMARLKVREANPFEASEAE